MLNKIVLMGRLTRDPELRQTPTGNSVVSFTLACDRDFAAHGAEKETDFVDIVAWRGTAEMIDKYFSKGRMMIVTGRLQIRNWQDKDGNKRRSAEIVAENVYFGDFKPQSGQSQQAAQSAEFSQLPDSTPVPFKGSDMPQMELDADALNAELPL
mgnify:CR=1 FL=1